MKKIEKDFLEDYSNSMKSTKNFDDISKHIDYSKYKKEKKSFWNSKNLSILATSFAVALSLGVVLPIALVWAADLIFRHFGLIKEGDLKI